MERQKLELEFPDASHGIHLDQLVQQQLEWEWCLVPIHFRVEHEVLDLASNHGLGVAQNPVDLLELLELVMERGMEWVWAAVHFGN